MTRCLQIAAIALALGCGGDDGTPDPGGGQNRLEILDPPGDSIGLAFSDSEALRVRYLDSDGEPIAGATVEFFLQVGASEDAGGSALSAVSAVTGAGGVAELEVTAGTSDANFRVRAEAPGAPPAVFFVVVSDTGFASFAITPSHSGPRAAADFTNIELRLFSPDQLGCAGLDVDDLPESIFPPRSVATFTESVGFQNLAAARPYVLVAWAEAEAGAARLATGCVEMSAEQVKVGPAIGVVIDVADRALAWPEPVTITSALILPNLDRDLDAALAPDPWLILSCPVGAAQLAIDCALDAAVADGVLDCAVAGAGPLIDDFEAARGAVDGDGCRPAEISGGAASLDRLVADAMTAGPWTEASAIDLAMARHALLAGARITSELSLETPAAAAHRLRTLTLTAAAMSRETDLGASARPVLEAEAAATVDAFGVVTIAEHRFTLDLDRAADDMFTLDLLPAFGLDGRRDDLGAALIESFGGCAAFSAVACAAAGQPDTCIETACAAAGPALDSRLLGWIGVLDVGGLDVSMSGAAAIEDRDFDLASDTIGGGSVALDGTWQIAVDIAGGSSTGAGAFGGQR